MPVIAECKGYEYIPSEKVIGAIIENENLLNEKKKPIISKEILHHKIFVEENKKKLKKIQKFGGETQKNHKSYERS